MTEPRDPAAAAEPALAGAAAAVARDLGRVAADVEAAVAHRRWWLGQWPDGAPHVLGLLAQDVQEQVQERDPLWPLCTEPSCPERHRHALFVEPDLGPDPFWTCHRTGLPVAPVGRLRGEPTTSPSVPADAQPPGTPVDGPAGGAAG